MLITKYRPQTMTDYIFSSQEQLNLYNEIKRNNQVSHLILYGPPGTGKTTFFEVIFNALGISQECGNLLKVDTADDGKNVKDFKRLLSTFIDGPAAWFVCNTNYTRQVVFLDEADQMVPNVQQWLKSNIEATQHRVSYVMTTNHIKNIDDAVKRRCRTLNIASHHSEIIDAKLRWVAEQESIKITDDEIELITNRCGSNIAQAMNDLDDHRMKVMC